MQSRPHERSQRNGQATHGHWQAWQMAIIVTPQNGKGEREFAICCVWWPRRSAVRVYTRLYCFSCFSSASAFHPSLTAPTTLSQPHAGMEAIIKAVISSGNHNIAVCESPTAPEQRQGHFFKQLSHSDKAITRCRNVSLHTYTYYKYELPPLYPPPCTPCPPPLLWLKPLSHTLSLSHTHSLSLSHTHTHTLSLSQTISLTQEALGPASN